MSSDGQAKEPEDLSLYLVGGGVTGAMPHRHLYGSLYGNFRNPEKNNKINSYWRRGWDSNPRYP